MKLLDVKALVLTFDKYRPFAENMIIQYRKLLPDHDLEFYIPYQKNDHRGSISEDERLHFVLSPKEIIPTVFTLLDQCQEDEVVYWCIDDKYPTWVDRSVMNKVLAGDGLPDFQSFCPCRCRTLYRKEHVAVPDVVARGEGDFTKKLLVRKSYTEIWLHQLVAVRILRDVFTRFRGAIKNAKEMDAEVDSLLFVEDVPMFVARRSFINFGESTSRGAVTKNCADRLKMNKIELSDEFEVSRRKIYLGKRFGAYEKIYYSRLVRMSWRWLARVGRRPRLIVSKIFS